MPNTSRDAFLQRVRQAVQQGNRPGDAVEIPARGQVGYQGAGADPMDRFGAELTVAGGFPHIVADANAAVAKVIALVQSKSARKALLGRGPFIDGLPLAECLRTIGVEVTSPEDKPTETRRESFFAADIGITGTDYLIAETGSVALLCRPDEPRSFSLLPPVHIVVAERSQILPDLFDLFGKLEETGKPMMPSCLAIITGPSKTGDIELRLVTGVHGPGEIHVIVAH